MWQGLLKFLVKVLFWRRSVPKSAIPNLKYTEGASFFKILLDICLYFNKTAYIFQKTTLFNEEINQYYAFSLDDAHNFFRSKCR